MDHVESATEQELVTALAAFPKELQRLLDGYAASALRRPASDGGWSVGENLCHLRDWERVFVDRTRAIVDQVRPKLPAYDDALWEIERGYREQDPAAALRQFIDLRQEMVATLSELDGDGWQREGIHALHGLISIRWIAGYLATHDREHLSQIGDALL
ncbi:MAG: DinB family protein [Chloroflexia bacterium]|nr:DinB family protein [Chloroflexia bacterium]